MDKDIKTIPWWDPVIGDTEYRRVADVLASNFINDGRTTTEFENRIASLLGCKHAVAVTNGTSALFAAMAALGIGPGDEVIIPDATFIATANAVCMAGAMPVLADIEPLSMTLCPAAFERAITPRTKAVIPVHVSGRAADLESIVQIADSHGIALIEDAAEAFMSKVGGRYLGTAGMMGCFSFSPLKLITTGQGGMVVTDDEALHGRLRQIKDQGRPAHSSGTDDIIPSVGYNFKLTNLQAAVGLGQLETLDWRMERLARNYRFFDERLAEIDGIVIPGFRVDEGELPLWTDVLAERRDELADFLKARGIDCRRFWIPIHTQPSFRAGDKAFPNTIAAMPKALWLPAAFNLTDSELDYVCFHIRAFYEGVHG